MKAQEKITIGKNLRRIRKELNLKQTEIVGEEVTRNLISMIEHEKTPMSYRIAQIAAENMNRICKERGMEVYIDPEDIMNPDRVEAKRQADRYIKFLKNNLKEQKYILEPIIEEITVFLNEWKIPEKKVEIYELLAEISYLNGEMDWEYLYLNKALENYFLVPVKSDIHVIGKNLISNCIRREKYKEAVTLIKLDIMSKDNIPSRDRAVTYYNEILTYKRLEDYNKALEMLDKYEEFLETNNTKIFKMALIVKGTCYYGMGENSKAIDVYKRVINSFDDKVEEVALAYSNISIILREMDLGEEVEEYRDKILNILKHLEKTNNPYLVDIYCRLGETHEYLGEIDLAEYYYITAIDKALEKKEREESAKILFKLLNLYSTTNQSEKILLSNNIFKRGFENSELSSEMKLAFSLILANMELGKDEIASGIINDILKEGKENEN